MPKNRFIRRIRADRAFPNDTILRYFESQTYRYVIKVKYTERLKQVVEYLDEHNLWKEIEDGLQTAELCIPLTGWEKARLFVFIRKRPVLRDHNQPEQIRVVELSYEWDVQAIVTNEEDMTPLEVWHCYNGRTGIENCIEEGKNSYAMDLNAHHSYRMNEMLFATRVLAYNWVNWFKQSVLPSVQTPWELKTLRQKLINIPANVHGTRKKLKINYPPFAQVAETVRTVLSNLATVKSDITGIRLIS